MSAWWTLASTTFRLLVRRPPFWILVVLYPLVVAFVAWGAKAPNPFAPASAIGVLIAIILTAGIIGDEIESGHLQIIAVKPVARSVYLLGRAAGAWFANVVVLGLAFAVAIAVPGGVSVRTAILACALEVLRGAGWIAATTALSVVVPRSWNAPAVAIGLVAWQILAMGMQAAFGPGAAARMDSASDLLTPPDFSILVSDLAARESAAWSDLSYGVFYAAAALLVGVLLLRRREIASRRP